MKTTEQQHNARKREMMEKCFECYAENGLTGTGIKALADACGCTKANLYSYFKNLDELIIESTAYCMEKVEDDFMEMAPTDPKDVVRFVKEVPVLDSKKHGKKYRLMYQIYTHPKYIEHGKKFFEGVNERYTEYAKRLEPKIGIPYTVITPLIFIFVRACVHYAMFEDEYYLKTQMEVLKQGLPCLWISTKQTKHKPVSRRSFTARAAVQNSAVITIPNGGKKMKTGKKLLTGTLLALCALYWCFCSVLAIGWSKAAKNQHRTAGGAEQRHGDQWKYSDETDWHDLVALTELQGAAGENGKDGTKTVKTALTVPTVKNGINGTNGKDGINGVDGKERSQR